MRETPFLSINHSFIQIQSHVGLLLLLLFACGCCGGGFCTWGGGAVLGLGVCAFVPFLPLVCGFW